MTEVREEVKGCSTREHTIELASEEALTAVKDVGEVNICMSTEKKSPKIQLSDDSDSESDDTGSESDETDETECETDNSPDKERLDVNTDTVVNSIEKDAANQEVKIIRLNRGFENMNMQHIELDIENICLFRSKSKNDMHSTDVTMEILSSISGLTSPESRDIEIDEDISDIVEIKEDIVEIKEDIVEIKEDIVEIKEDIVEIKEDIVEIKEDIVEIKEDVEIKEEAGDNSDATNLAKYIESLSQFKVEELRKMLHAKTGEKKETIKKLKKNELIVLLSNK
jgi:hypothetical protein